MRDFSKVSPSVWRSRKFKSLGSDRARMLYLYLLTCPHGNSAGCFDMHPMYAAADLGWLEKDYLDALESLSKASLVEVDWEENTLLIVNWEAFNEPTNPRHAQGILTQLSQASSDRLKAIAFHCFLKTFRAKAYDRDKALREAISIFLKAYPEPIPTETKRETETEIETRPDRDLDLRAREVSALAAAPSRGDGFAPSGVNPELIELASRLSARTPDFPEIPTGLVRRKA